MRGNVPDNTDPIDEILEELYALGGSEIGWTPEGVKSWRGTADYEDVAKAKKAITTEILKGKIETLQSLIDLIAKIHGNNWSTGVITGSALANERNALNQQLNELEGRDGI